MAQPKTVDWLVMSAGALDNALTVKAATWQDAVNQAVTDQRVTSGRLVCVPVSSVQRVRVESYPSMTVTPE